ncbi:hypothetical protein [Occallatibacter savannae]|nr:hypothetical protein [Occallatibacter savannae]
MNKKMSEQPQDEKIETEARAELARILKSIEELTEELRKVEGEA